MSDDARIVWRSGIGRVKYCRRCGAPEGECSCGKGSPSPSQQTSPRDGYLRVGRSSKGHAGKTVTTVTGAPGSPDDLRALVQTLKKVCGCGGTVQPDGILQLQGDVRQRVEDKLVDLGYKVKRVGG